MNTSMGHKVQILFSCLVLFPRVVSELGIDWQLRYIVTMCHAMA